MRTIQLVHLVEKKNKICDQQDEKQPCILLLQTAVKITFSFFEKVEETKLILELMFRPPLRKNSSVSGAKS